MLDYGERVSFYLFDAITKTVRVAYEFLSSALRLDRGTARENNRRVSVDGLAVKLKAPTTAAVELSETHTSIKKLAI